MPLVRGQNTVFETAKGIHFLMRDPNRREFIACLITHQALIDRGATHEPPLARCRCSMFIAAKLSEQQVTAGTVARWTATTSYNINTAQICKAEPIDVTLVPRPGGGLKKYIDNKPSTCPASESPAARKP